MKNLFAFLFILILSTQPEIKAQDQTPRTNWQPEFMAEVDFMGGSSDFSQGDGWMIVNFKFTPRINDRLLSIQGGRAGIYNLFGGEVENFWHLGLCYNKIKSTGSFHMGWSLGISYLNGTKEEKEFVGIGREFSGFQTIGVPVSAEFFWNKKRHAGFGLKTMVIINSVRPVFGIGWTLKIGEFSKRE